MAQLTFLGHDGAVYLADTDDAARAASLSEAGAVCYWPTWSGGGERLAYSVQEPVTKQYAVRIASADGKEMRTAYENDPGSSSIARETPHYLLWSPDGNSLAIVAQRRNQGLSLLIAHEGTDAPDEVITRGPIYSSWSHDSRMLFVHSFNENYLIDFSRGNRAVKVPGEAGSYMAPSWSPSAQTVAFCTDISQSEQALMIGDFASAKVKEALRLRGICAFDWNPAGTLIGLAKDVDRNSGYFAGISILDPATGVQSNLTEDWVLAFFWSPDGSRIAYVTPSDGGEGSIRWAVVSVADRDTFYLADFRPTQQQIIQYMFFDQYTQSHSPWSPDGTALVFSGTLGFQLIRSELPTGPDTGVYLVSAARRARAVEVAKGTFGIWRPSL